MPVSPVGRRPALPVAADRRLQEGKAVAAKVAVVKVAGGALVGRLLAAEAERPRQVAARVAVVAARLRPLAARESATSWSKWA